MTLPLAEQSPEAPTSAAEVWGAVQDLIKPALSDGSYRMWFAGVEAHSVDEAGLQLDAPSDYVKNWLVAHYLELLTDSTRSVLGPQAVVRIDVAPDAGDPEATATEAAAGAPGRRRGRRTTHEPDPAQATLDEALDPATAFPDRYTFDAFVPGSSNKFAHAAAMAVAEAPPSRVYNPLFVYGGVGLGKTHLLFAIGQHMTRLNPRVRVRYVTSESFMTEFIRAVRDRRGYLFQRQYRDIDVLLLDDVQFLARAEETQTEFFHTFNHLHQHERQIVIASDRPPQELGGIEERLRSRFRSGLVVDVQPPDLETRVAILQMKAIRDRLDVPEDVQLYIATRFDSNIRELEGALLRVAAFASLSHQPVDLELAQRALEDLLPDSGREITAPVILEETASYFGIEREELLSKSRSRPLTTARHVSMYLMRELTGLSLIKIGEYFNRDHTTALHGIKKIEALMPARGSTYRQVQELTKKIRARSRRL
jgi:chromosomal replication initiator protein